MTTALIVECGLACVGALYSLRHYKLWLIGVGLTAANHFVVALANSEPRAASDAALTSIVGILGTYGLCRLLSAFFVAPAPATSDPHSAWLQQQYSKRF